MDLRKKSNKQMSLFLFLIQNTNAFKNVSLLSWEKKSLNLLILKGNIHIEDGDKKQTTSARFKTFRICQEEKISNFWKYTIRSSLSLPRKTKDDKYLKQFFLKIVLPRKTKDDKYLNQFFLKDVGWIYSIFVIFAIFDSNWSSWWVFMT